MKFPGGDRLRKIWDAFNAPAVDPNAPIAALEAAIEAEKAAKAARNHEALRETAGALVDVLGNTIGERAVPLPPEREGSDLWLLSLARARSHDPTDRTAPGRIRLYCLVSALNMSEADIPGVPSPGGAFMLAGVSEQARFSWEIVSLQSHQ